MPGDFDQSDTDYAAASLPAPAQVTPEDIAEIRRLANVGYSPCDYPPNECREFDRYQRILAALTGGRNAE